MACTSQSAKEYIWNARRHLVGELKSHSVILENLYQKGVLHPEEVSTIEAETTSYDKTRKLLDTVVDKGEEACYVLLTIIDMTRKRTLGRPLLPEEKRGPSTFDLHQWISCFPFKEDAHMDTSYLQGPRPCHKYHLKLKSKAQKISNEFWRKSKNLFDGNNKSNPSYIPLVLDTQGKVSTSKIKKIKSKKSKMSRPKKLRTYIPEEKTQISPNDLLKTEKNVLLVGKPGIGKTTLCYEMLKRWSEGENKELDYMFYFDMRETSRITAAKSLEELLFGVFSEPEEDKEEVLQDLKKNSDNVTIIFDGITDLNSSSVVQDLVNKDLLPYAKIFITCRLDDEEEEDFLPGDFLRVEVRGFSEQTIKTYLSAMLGEEHTKVSCNLELLTLCHAPMYALMVAVCYSSVASQDSLQSCTMTEIYINIIHHCIKVNSKTKTGCLHSFISNKKEEILSLAEAAFIATEGKTVNMTEVPCEDSCFHSLLKPLVLKVAPIETKTLKAFLHYTVQEFFAALWLLKNPEKIRVVFQQCLTEEMKHMKHLIPFMCRLLNEKHPTLMTCLIPDQELKNTSTWFFKELITTFLPRLCDQDEADCGNLLFLLQCLYESQCPETCLHFLDKLNYRLDLSGENLDPYHCCAVSYVVSQSNERKTWLNLEDATVSEEGISQLFRCLQNVQWCDPLPQQLWQIVLLSEGQMEHISLLDFDGNRLHLPVKGDRRLFERAAEVIQKTTLKVNVCLHRDRTTPVCQSLSESLFNALPNIKSISLDPDYPEEGIRFMVNLFCAAAEREEQTGEKILELLSSVCSDQTFPVMDDDDDADVYYQCDLLLDLCSQVKDCETKTGRRILPALQSVFQSPTVWIIDLSKRKVSILLEVLKLQSEKKQVKLVDCSDEESEVRSFLQCLPYISQLSLDPDYPEEGIRFMVNLFCAAAEKEEQTGEKILELLSSVYSDQTFPLMDGDGEDGVYYQCCFLLDLYSQVKDCETKTGRRFLPALQSVFQSPTVWFIDLSKRKVSILLEVLKLQSEKKQVKLIRCSDEESEVRSFLQCLPYISQLSLYPDYPEEGIRFMVNLFCAAAEREEQTGEKILELLSVCSDQTFPLMDGDGVYYQCCFLLDLYSQVKDYETNTGRRILPALQSVFQSPTVWIIDLSERKVSILLEVLKLQSEKKQVELRRCSDEESEVRSFLQCLPYISQLSLDTFYSDKDIRFMVNLFCAAAEREEQTGEKILELLSSVCSYQTFPLMDGNVDYQCELLLDLYSQVKDCETKTGRRILPALQSVFQSPTVWIIDLSERKVSILLEVLKLQSEKKQVKLIRCSDEESEVRSFLQCLPYISQLRCDPEFFQCVCSSILVRSKEEIQQLVSVLQLLGFNLPLTGDLDRKTCHSAGRVLTLCGSKVDLSLTPRKMSVRGAALLFQHTTQLHRLRLSSDAALILCRWISRGRVARLLAVEELSLTPETPKPSEGAMLRVVSNLASLLRHWTVRRLELTELSISVQGLIPLLLHQGPLSIKLSEEHSQQLLDLLYETQDKVLTWSFLSKVDADLTSCCLNWEVLQYLLQQEPAQTITVNQRKNGFLQDNVTRLIPFLDRILFKRPSPAFVLTAIREIYRTGACDVVSSLLRSLDHVILLTCRQLDSVDCAALVFILQHSDRVKVNLLWTSIPTEGIESVLFMLDNISELSVDRNLLLRFIHCCAASEAQQGAAPGLLRTLQHRLDLSCSSSVALPEEDQTEALSLTAADCRAVSTVLNSSTDTQLDLRDCEVGDSGLDLLFPVLHRVRLRASKAVLLRLVSLVPVSSEGDTLKRGQSLWRALGEELDLSHTALDHRSCEALAPMLDLSEGLRELDLSHCQLTDQLLLTLITHLHKVQVLDLSHNNITDAVTRELLQLVCINPSIEAVRLFNNNIVDRTRYKEDKRFEIW